jgi:hypothetical protein
MPDKYITLSTSKMKLGLTFWSPILHINITWYAYQEPKLLNKNLKNWDFLLQNRIL